MNNKYGKEVPDSCEGNHTPACPNRLFCACTSDGSNEEHAMVVFGEEERHGLLDLNAVGGYDQKTALFLSCDNDWLRLAVMRMGGYWSA